MLTTHQKNLAAIIHLSTFSKFFIPLGNFILPLILWTMNKDKSEFVDEHGKQAINFQLVFYLYAIAAVIITIPIFLYVFAGSFPEEFFFNNHNVYIDGNDIHTCFGLHHPRHLGSNYCSNCFCNRNCVSYNSYGKG